MSNSLPTYTRNYTNFETWLFGPGTVFGSKLRVLDVLIIIGVSLLFVVLLIITITTWNDNTNLQKQINELKNAAKKRYEPVKKALDNTIGVFELKEAKGSANGYTELDSLGKIPANRLPQMTINDVSRTRTVDASLIANKFFPNPELKFLRPGRCIGFKETKSFIEIINTCSHDNVQPQR